MKIKDLDIEVVTNGFAKHNAYFLIKGNDCVVVDTGSDYTLFHDFLKTRKLNLITILYTHGHFDHFGNLNNVIKHFPNVKYYGSKHLAEVISNEKIHLGDKSLSIKKPNVQILKEDHLYKFMGIKFICLFTPGHIKDHMCFYLPDYKICFTGDLLFKNAIGAVRFPTNEPELMPISLKKVFSNCDINTIIFTGHGSHSTLSDEKKFNPYLINLKL